MKNTETLSKYFAKKLYDLHKRHHKEGERIDTLLVAKPTSDPTLREIHGEIEGRVLSFSDKGIFIYPITHHTGFFPREGSPFFKRDTEEIDYDPAKDRSYRKIFKKGQVDLGNKNKVFLVELIEKFLPKAEPLQTKEILRGLFWYVEKAFIPFYKDADIQERARVIKVNC